MLPKHTGASLLTVTTCTEATLALYEWPLEGLLVAVQVLVALACMAWSSTIKQYKKKAAREGY